jgi:alpha-mannosidase
MYQDIPGLYDAWNIDSVYENTPVALTEKASVQIIAQGPIVASIKITRKLNHSLLIQEISLINGSRRLDFKTAIDWKEEHKLLKVAFPVNIRANTAAHEIQFGHIHRPTHKSRPYDADRYEVSNHKWSAVMEENMGVAILNDCKYGVNVLGNSLNLTLLKSAVFPDINAENRVHEFTYAFYVWHGSFFDSALIREAYELNCPVVTTPGSADEVSLFALSSPNIIIETVKLCEDKSGDYILRLYESKRAHVDCVLSISTPVSCVWETDMLERKQHELLQDEGKISLSFRPFEIKTVRVSPV